MRIEQLTSDLSQVWNFLVPRRKVLLVDLLLVVIRVFEEEFPALLMRTFQWNFFGSTLKTLELKQERFLEYLESSRLCEVMR